MERVVPNALTRVRHRLRDKAIHLIFLSSLEISVVRSFANRTPSEATPVVDGDGNRDRKVYSVFSIAPRGGERRANGQSAANHPGYGDRNNIGNTIGTSRVDRSDESNLCAAVPLRVATRSRQNNSATPALDPVKASRV